MRKDNLIPDFEKELDLLQSQLLASCDDVNARRLRSMIEFRQSEEALCGYEELIQCNPSDFIQRACACHKRILLSEEDVSTQKLKGNILERMAAKYRTVTQMYRLLDVAAKRANRSMGREGTMGVLGGYITDGFYQSPALFPEFIPNKNELSFFEKLKRNSVGTVEMRNRYRRVLALSISKDRIAYFRRKKKIEGAGTPENPIFFASIGGGTGSLEMDLQQQLREKYGIHTCIVIFDVVDQNRIDGSFFAKMRGASIYWVIQRPSSDDLLTRQSRGTLKKFLTAPLWGLNAYGDYRRIAAGSCGRFHHVIMSGLWAKFDDAHVLDFLAITKKMLCRGAQAVVTLSVNTYFHKVSSEKVIPAMTIIDRLGHAEGGVWYRSIASLKKRGLLNKRGFAIVDELSGPIFPVIAIAPV